MEIKNYSMWKFKWSNDEYKNTYYSYYYKDKEPPLVYKHALIKGYSSDNEVKGFNFTLSYKIN